MSKINKKLWGAAELLRGEIDSGDYKIVIFGLLFYKRLCDTFSDNWTNQKPLDYTIPKGCFWKNDPRPRSTVLSDLPKDYGKAITSSFQQIESSNPQFKDIFGIVDFQFIMDLDDDLIFRLMTHFEGIDLSASIVDLHMLGDAYEYLLKQFATDSGKGEFYTPKAVVQLMVKILEPGPNMSIYDPTCGAGGMLLEANKHIRRNDANAIPLLYGQEKNKITWRIARINLALQNIPAHNLLYGDTLRKPGHRTMHDQLKRFDRVLANPPFSLKKWGHDLWGKGDLYNRDRYGIPPKTYGDLAFVQHMIESLTPNGRLAVVVPNGVLFRLGTELKIRKGLIKDNLIETIVSLGPNLFFAASIPASIIFINKNKAKDETILMVNATKLFKSGSSQNELMPQHVDTIATCVIDKKEIPFLSTNVSASDIKDMGYNLSPTRYIDTNPPEKHRSASQIVKEINAINLQIRELENNVLDSFKR